MSIDSDDNPAQRGTSSVSIEGSTFWGSLGDIAGRDINKTFEGSAFWGSSSDIAGRDINKTFIIDRRVTTPRERAELELDYLTRLTNETKGLVSRFVQINLKLDTFFEAEGAKVEQDSYNEVITPKSLSGTVLEETGNSSGNIIVRSVMDLFRYSRFWILKGDSGTGKTTLLRKTAADQAQLMIPSIVQYIENPLNTSRYEKKLPLYISLLAYNGTQSVIELLRNSWLGTPLGLDLEMYLRLGDVLLLIDEMGSIPWGARATVLQEIWELTSLSEQNLCIVATYRFSLSRELDFPGCTIEPFTPIQSKEMLYKYFGALGEDLLRRLTESKNEMLWLTKRPYSLLMLADYYSEKHGELPANLALLFDGYTDSLLHRQLQKRHLGPDQIDTIRTLLGLLAYELTKGCPRDEVLSLVSTSEEIEQETCNMVVELAGDAGILLVDGDNLDFSHQQLKAYFSALSIKNSSSITVSEFVSQLGMDVGDPSYQIPRAKIFQTGLDEILAWDTPTPYLARGRWFYTVKMLLNMFDSQDPLVEELLQRDPILVADLIDANEHLAKGEVLLSKLKTSLLQLMTKAGANKRVRMTAGYWLGILGDNRLTDDPMVLVEGTDKFSFGWGINPQEMFVKSFWVDRYLVTNTQFREFFDDKGYSNRQWWTDEGWDWKERNRRKHPTFWSFEQYSAPNLPVVGVSWHEAVAFAAWKGCRLLTEPEWEFLATYHPSTKKKTRYPWGNEFIHDAANLMIGDYLYRTTPVGMYPLGANDWGVYDLAGNVWEWLSSLYLPQAYQVERAEQPRSRGDRCLRGGSWGFDQKPGAVGYTRHFGNPGIFEYRNVGFRCARDD